jgi:mannose-6-phosphate isomerase-like protein (cupin superfamily)
VPVVTAGSATVHELHGARFTSYVSPSSGSAELCSWRLDVPGGTIGVPHRPSREEVLVVVAGSARVTLDGQAANAGVGDVVVVPANASFQLDNPGVEPLTAWVSTSVGLEAELPDGTRLTPPWAS